MSNYPILLCLGTNIDQERHMKAAHQQLKNIFADIVFTRNMWTAPVGISSPHYLNCLAKTQTAMSYEAANKLLKDIEQAMGRTSEDKRQHIVKIDIDILQYDKQRFHPQDWERAYVQQLLTELP